MRSKTRARRLTIKYLPLPKVRLGSTDDNIVYTTW